MSQYPYGYGQYPGHNPQQQQYTYPPYTGYSAPTYTPQPDPGVIDAHYAASQNSFNYNATSIPGLGIVGTPTGTSPYPGLGGGAGWNQQHPMSNAPPVSAFPFPAHPPPHTAPVSQPYSPAHPQTFAPPVPAPSRVPEPEPEPDKAYEPENEESAEEGEVSEGEFDDLYEPRETVVSRINGPSVLLEEGSKASESRDESMVDPQDTNFYETEVEEVAVGQNGPSMTTGVRERSGSYSPYLSPREIHHDASASEESTSNSSENLGAAPASNQPGPPNGSSDIPHTTVPRSQDITSTPEANSLNTAKPAVPSFKNVAEAKKEAQKAILRLLPHGVKFQTYLDEGFDEKVIKTLFTELNLIPSSGSPTIKMSSTQAEKEKGPADKAQTPATTGTSKTEERKDRIARLLAQKAAKTSTSSDPAPSTTKPVSSSKPAAGRQPTTATTKSKIDKDLILKQKLEALRKTQKSQALKASGAKDTMPASNSEGSSRPPTGTPQPLATSGLSRQQSPLHRPPQTAVLPALLTSTNQTAQSVNQRKRPVASDFVDYPSTKRPFGQNHQSSSLVIDISDESDDDVEMDMDSPEDGPPTGAIPPASSIPRGPSIRDFPPLSNNLPNRQYSSPAPSSDIHTPPHHVNGKPAESEYLRKMKEIAEIKRRIAEKEAKKGAKPGSVGPQTPNGGSRTPPDLKAIEASESRLHEALSSEILNTSDGPSAQLISEAESIKLPKRSDLASNGQESARDRRLRISSVQLPRIEVGLAEKNAKLKLLRDAEARLQAEINEAMAEQRRLNEEMELLDQESLETPAQPSGVESEDSSGDSSPSFRGDQDVNMQSADREVQATGQDSPTRPSGDIKDVNETNIVMSGALSPGTSVNATPAVISEEVSAQLEPVLANFMDTQPQDPEASNNRHIDSDNTAMPTITQPDVPSSNPLEGDSEAVDIPMDMGSVDETLESAAPTSIQEINTTNAIPDNTEQAVGNGPATHEPLDAQPQVAADQIPLGSPPFSPAPAEATVSVAEDHSQDDKAFEHSGALPEQISSVDVQANDAALEEHAETADAPREDGDDNKPEVQTSFVAYESPLHYFHAYRFHPNYSKTVSGGLKSLTYSNKIDPKKEVCPYELDGQGCPKGDNCEFQHFEKMPAPDDQILLELGQSDEYTGEEKTRFMAGLRQLLTEFRAAKVKDFPSIAQGIVDYRRRFLNDPSKVLRLEGVHI